MSESQPESMLDLSKFITLKHAAEVSGLSYSHLRLLARRGDVWAIRLGHNWFTTAEAVKQYVAQEHKPGPKPSQSEKLDPEDS